MLVKSTRQMKATAEALITDNLLARGSWERALSGPLPRHSVALRGQVGAHRPWAVPEQRMPAVVQTLGPKFGGRVGKTPHGLRPVRRPLRRPLIQAPKWTCWGRSSDSDERTLRALHGPRSGMAAPASSAVGSLPDRCG